MLSRRAPDAPLTFTRSDLTRFVIAAVLLVVSLTVIFSLDLLPQRLQIGVGDVASADIVAPRAASYISDIATADAKNKASEAIAPIYDYLPERAAGIARVQVAAFESRVRPIDQAFLPEVKEDARKSILETAIPGLTPDARATLLGLDAEHWTAVHGEASRVLDLVEREELRDTAVEPMRLSLPGKIGLVDDKERTLAAELISPLVVPNSSFSQSLTDQELD